MIDWLVFGTYIAITAFVYRKAYVAMYEADRAEFSALSVAASDRAAIAFFSICCALFWPVVVTGWAIYRTLTPTPPSERLDRLREQQHEIARLERELGIGGRPS